jgi:hypothetical protein
VNLSVEMGKVSCILDPQAAAGRDEAMRSVTFPPPPPPPRMAGPAISADPADALAGTLSVQGTLRGTDGVDRRADEVLGSGFNLILRSGDPQTLVDANTLAWFTSVGGTTATLDSAVAGHITDVDGRLTAWLEDSGVAAVLSRPDQYVFASSDNIGDVATILNQLRRSLH